MRQSNRFFFRAIIIILFVFALQKVATYFLLPDFSYSSGQAIDLGLDLLVLLVSGLLLFSFFVNMQKSSIELAHEKEKFQRLIELCPIPVYVYTLEQFLYANPAGLQFVGFQSNAELQDHTVLEFIAPSYLDKATRQIQELENGEIVNREQYDLVLLDGSYRTVLLSTAKVVFAGISAFQTVVYDITGRMRMEKLLEENRQIYKSLFLYNLDAVFSMNEQGVIKSLNPAAKQMIGAKNGSIALGKPFTSIMNEHDAPIAWRHFEQAMAGTASSLEINLITPNKKRFDLFITFSPIVVDLKRVGVFCIARDVTETRRAERMITKMAYQDSLTGLPNRRSFQEQLAERVQQGVSVCVMFLDLDRFKPINDTFGHDAGDLLLQIVSQRLQKSMRATDLVSRLGGDEFTLLIHVQDRDSAAQAAERILEVMQEPLRIKGHEVSITPSIGIAMYPQDGNTADELILHADTAMYHAKKREHGHYAFYSPAFTNEIVLRSTLEQRLQKALANDEFFLHYQPRFNLATKRLVGMEVLLRWEHASPAEFIPIAEESGLIHEIGKWVLTEACHQMQGFVAAGAELRVSVNLSSRQLKDQNLEHLIKQTLENSQLDGKYLELEITESLIMENLEDTLQFLHHVKALGVKISLDDFGTGFSSLSYLHDLPIDMLKIDRSFILGIGKNGKSKAIVRTIIQLGKSLGINVVAEGVETAEQLAFLQQEGCDEVQGFLLGKPMSYEDFVAFLQHQQKRGGSA